MCCLATPCVNDGPVLVAAETLVTDVGDVLRVLEGTRQAPPTPGPAAIWTVYPELHDAVRKVVDACAHGDVARATLEAWLLQRDIDATLLGGDTGSAGNLHSAHVDAGPVRAAFGLVDLLAIPARALSDLANAALDIDAQLLAAARGRPPRLETLDDLRAHLRESSARSSAEVGGADRWSSRPNDLEYVSSLPPSPGEFLTLASPPWPACRPVPRQGGQPAAPTSTPAT